MVILPTSTLFTTSTPLDVVPTITKYPVAFGTAFQLKEVSIATSVALFNGVLKLVQTGGTGISSVLKLSSIQAVASPSPLYGVIVTKMSLSSGRSAAKSYVNTFPTSTLSRISLPPIEVPTVKRYPSAFEIGFQVKSVLTTTSVSLFTGEVRLVHSGIVAGSLEIVKLSSVQGPTASPSSLKGIKVT